MKYCLRALAFAGVIVAGLSSAFGQAQLPSGYMMGNSGASTGVARPDSLTNYLDRVFGATTDRSIFRDSGGWAVYNITAFGRTLVDDADAATARVTLGAVIGTNVQAWDADLDALAGLTSAADKLPYFTGSSTAALADFTAYGRSVVAVANEAAFKALVNLEIGTDVQAYHARLANISGITYAQGDIFYFDGTNIVKLAKGIDGQFLKITATIPAWAAVPGGGDTLNANNLSDMVSAATAFGNIKQAATASVTGVVKRQRMAYVREEQVSNTAGGTFTSGAERTRTLNTETDPDGIVSTASNQFTLPAGTYKVEWSAPAFGVARHRTFLYNATDASEVSRGTAEYTDSTAQTSVTRSHGVAIVTIAGSKAFEIRHQAQTTKTTDGFGIPTNMGTEVYTTVFITSYDQ